VVIVVLACMLQRADTGRQQVAIAEVLIDQLQPAQQAEVLVLLHNYANNFTVLMCGMDSK
jgi:hypothetical protein